MGSSGQPAPSINMIGENQRDRIDDCSDEADYCGMRINVPDSSSNTVTEVIAVSSNKKITYHLCFVG